MRSSTLPWPISSLKLILGILLPSSLSFFHYFFVTLALSLSPFSSGGHKNVLVIKLSGSNSGIGLTTDGLSSCLDLMKTVGTLGYFFDGAPSEDPDDDPDSPPFVVSL